MIEPSQQNCDTEDRAGRCRHCGSAILTGRSDFCCRGCEVVYRVIHNVGLDYYYSLPRDNGHVAEEPGDYSYFDDPLFLERFTVDEGKDLLRRVTFFLPGIHCSACIWLLERLPQVATGIRALRVDFSKNAVTLIYNTRDITLSEIGLLLASVGYAPLPSRNCDLDRQQQAVHRAGLIRLGVAAVCLMNIMMLAVSLYEGEKSGISPRYQSLFSWISLTLCLPPILYCAQPFYRSALGGLRAGILHIDLPISIALVFGFLTSVANVCLGRGEIYFDSIAGVIFLLLAGRMFQQRTVSRVLDSVGMLSAFTPQSTTRVLPEGDEQVYVESLAAGDVVRIASGEVIPADGRLISPQACVNNSVLTGESDPERLVQGARVFAGCSNVAEQFLLQVEAVGVNTRLGAILSHVQHGARERAPIERFLDRVARRFTFLVLGVALGTIIVVLPHGLGAATDRVLALLIVSCPCAIALATPLAFAVAIGRAARAGFLLKSAEVIERLSQVSAVFFDKTGTLTEGRIAVDDVVWHGAGMERELEVRSIVGALEQGIEHPIAKALSCWAGHSAIVLQSAENVSGRGVCARGSGGEQWHVGSAQWFRELGINTGTTTRSGAVSWVGIAGNKELLASIYLSDKIREDAHPLVQELAAHNIAVGVLSGDSIDAVSHVASSVGISANNSFGELSPEAKAERIRHLPDSQVVAMVGDGVNDVAALHAADVGIGVSGGAEACLKTADVYVTAAGLRPIMELLRGSRRAMWVVRRNLLISVLYNLAGGAFAVLGYIGPLEAAVLMPISSLTVVLLSTYGRSFRVTR